jgi:hypothetical protein
MYVIEQRLNANSNEITGGDGSNVPAYGPLTACTGTVGAARDMLECLLAHSAPRSTLRSVESRSALTNSTIEIELSGLAPHVSIAFAGSLL